jgi:hypothetical protein
MQKVSYGDPENAPVINTIGLLEDGPEGEG